MKSKKFIAYIALCSFLYMAVFYLMPYISLLTMSGDKTDILMGMMLFFVPLGLLATSIIMGLLTEKVVVPSYVAAIISLTYLLVPIVSGHSLSEKLAAMGIIIPAVFIIVLVGTAIGIFLRRLFDKFKSIAHTK